VIPIDLDEGGWSFLVGSVVRQPQIDEKTKVQEVNKAVLVEVGWRALAQDWLIQGLGQNCEVRAIDGAVAVEVTQLGDTASETDLAIAVPDEQVPIAILGTEAAFSRPVADK
jgi:hypothetical protein